MNIRAPYAWAERGKLIADAVVRVEGSRIAGIGRARDADGRIDSDLDGCILLPGLVNAHTHLELGFIAGRCPPGPDFTRWIRALVRERGPAGQRIDFVPDAVRRGLNESLAGGVTLIGDITSDPDVVRVTLAGVHQRPAVVSYGEVIAVGRMRHGAEEATATAASEYFASDDLGIGISPHAPYTVEPQVMELCAAIAANRGLPLSIHAAETRAERAWTLRGDGEFRELLQELRVWDDAIPVSGCSPIALLDRCHVLSPRTLLAHANYVDDDDTALLAAAGASVAWCPRTHAAFGHEPHPFRKLQAEGVNVCLGTDSLASNPSLSLLDEMRFVYAQHPDVSPETILDMGTTAGAEALGAGDKTGRLAVGLRADMIAIPLDPEGSPSPLENILRGNRPLTASWIAGNRVAPHVLPEA